MKTINLPSESVSAAELLNMARNDSVLVKTSAGDSFLVSRADEFATEAELLRRNHTFLTMLDKFKKDRESIPLNEAEKRFR